MICEYKNQDISGLLSFVCGRMKLLECCISLLLVTCCFVQISEPRTNGKDSQKLLKLIVEAFRIVPQTDDSPLSKAIYNLFPPIIPLRIYEPLNPFMPRIQKMVRRAWNFIYIAKRMGEEHIWNFIALRSVVPEISLWANRVANAGCTEFSLFSSLFMKHFWFFFSILVSVVYR